MRNKQTAWCVVSVLILVVTVGVVGVIPNARASEYQRPVGTDVSGIISTNTVWNLAGSPYSLTDRVQVAPAVTLTVQPGVVINGNGYALEVFGALTATGNLTSRVIINDLSINPGVNTHDVFIGIQFTEINSGKIYALGGGTYGGLWLRDSIVKGLTSPIYLWYPVLDSYIERNVFYRSSGISVGTWDKTVYIRNNLFLEQALGGDNSLGYAVEAWAEYKVAGIGNVVELNSFLSLDRRALYLPSGYSSAGMTAINNYWGGAGTTVIDSMIFDKNDDFGVASVINYLPVLSAPHPDTPLFDPPTPTPTPTATATSTSTETPTPSSTPTQTPVPEGIYAPRAYLPSAFRQVPLPTITPTPTATSIGSNADGYEPNDSPSEVLNRPGGAISYINTGSQIAGVNFYPYGGRSPVTATGALGDVDWYFFYGKKILTLGGTGGCYQIKTAIQPGVDTDISIYSDALTSPLAHNDDVAPLNRSSQINLALTDNGRYWIKVLNLDSSPRGIGQTYSISVVEYLPTSAGCAMLTAATSTNVSSPSNTPTPTVAAPEPPPIIITTP